MCNYCKDIAVGIFKTLGSCRIGEIAGMTTTAVLAIDQDHLALNIFSGGIASDKSHYIDINYCPMCGEKLKRRRTK